MRSLRALEAAFFALRFPRLGVAASLAALLTISAHARAEEFTRRSFILPDGAFEITGEPARPKILGVNVSEDRAFKPVYVAPHFYWGASSQVTLGITHQRGLCLTGPDGGCGDRPYNDVGFAALVGLVTGRVVELDLHVGVPIGSFDPFVIGARTGVLGKIRGGSVAFVFDPYVYVGFNRRDQGNGDALVLPFWIYIQASRHVVPFFGLAFEGPLDDFSARSRVPLEGGVVFDVTDGIDLGAMLRFDNPLGHDSTWDRREVGMLARFRF